MYPSGNDRHEHNYVPDNTPQAYSARSQEHGGNYVPGSATPYHQVEREEHGGNYVPGSAPAVFSTQEEQHGGNYVPGSAPTVHYPGHNVSPMGSYESFPREPHNDNRATGHNASAYPGNGAGTPYGGSEYTPRPSSYGSNHQIPRRQLPVNSYSSSHTTLNSQSYTRVAMDDQWEGNLPSQPGYSQPYDPSYELPPYSEQNAGPLPRGTPQFPSGSRHGPLHPSSTTHTQTHNNTQRSFRRNARDFGEMDIEEHSDGGQTMNSKRRPHVPLKGYRNILQMARGKELRIRLFKYPHFYKPASHTYTSEERFRHKDSLLRAGEAPLDDKYISPYNGRYEELVVQTVDDIFNSTASKGTWNRTFIRDISPWHLRLANWPHSHIASIKRANGRVTFGQKALVWVKYVPTIAAMLAVIAFPGDVEGEVRNDGRYDGFPYRFHGYSKVARNNLEERITREHARLSQRTHAVMMKRLLRPRKLCLIEDDPYNPSQPRCRVEDMPEDEVRPYLFISYTAVQFCGAQGNESLVNIAARVTKEHGLTAFWISCCCLDLSLNRTIRGGKNLQEDVYRMSDVVRGAEEVVVIVGSYTSSYSAITPKRDVDLRVRLKEWGKRLWTFPEILLSKNSLFKVYNGLQTPFSFTRLDLADQIWPDKEVSRQLVDHYEGNLQLSRLELVTISLECLFSRDTAQFLEGDHSYALMGLLRVRPQVDESDSAFQAFGRLSLANDSDLLLERLACFLPSDHDQPWHCMNDAYGVSLWDIYPSCQIAGIGDDNTVIVDGARGANVRWKSFASVHVRRRWSWKRLIFRTFLHTSTLFLLVGILLICLSFYIRKQEARAVDEIANYVILAEEWSGNLTNSTISNWENTTNSTFESVKHELERLSFFNVSGVVDVAKNSTNVALEGLKSIANKTIKDQSDSLYEKVKEIAWMAVKYIVHAIINEDAVKKVGGTFVAFAMFMAIIAPKSIRVLYGGKLWNTQPWLFGFEGYLPINQIECLIFGDERNRLRWHPFGSPLSRHRADESWSGGHCEPMDPTDDLAIRKMVEAAKTSDLGDQKVGFRQARVRDLY